MNQQNNAFGPIITGAGLTVTLLPGSASVGGSPTSFPTAAVSLAQNSTNYIYLVISGLVVTVNQTGFPSSGCYPIAIAKTGVSTVTSLTDSRPDLAFAGAQTIASGTAALGTSAINSGAAATTVTVTATGVLSTDTLMTDFNADPTGTTGYVPSANGMLTIVKYPSSNAVNFIVINNTGGSITPGAITLNWRVVR